MSSSAHYWIVVAVAVARGPDGQALAGCASCATDTVRYAQDLHERFPGDEGLSEAQRKLAKPAASAQASARQDAGHRVKYRLAPGDVLEEDASGHVAAVRHATSPPTWTRFKPGAESPPNDDVVWGEIDGP